MLVFSCSGTYIRPNCMYKRTYKKVCKIRTFIQLKENCKLSLSFGGDKLHRKFFFKKSYATF